MSWDVKKYKTVLNKIKDDGMLNGIPVKTKEDIYDIIASSLYINRDTAKGWTRPTSSGPKDEDVLMDIEKLLGVERHGFSMNVEEGDTTEMVVKVLSDINKQAIFKIYELMKYYLHDDEMEDEECFSRMWCEVEKQRILIPIELFSKVSEFVDNYIAPIVYEPKTIYASCYTDEIGFVNDDGNWEVKSEEALKQMAMNFMLKNIEIEEALDDFAMRELQPFLGGENKYA